MGAQREGQGARALADCGDIREDARRLKLVEKVGVEMLIRVDISNLSMARYQLRNYYEIKIVIGLDTTVLGSVRRR